MRSKGNTFPFDPDAFLTGTMEMTNEEVGIYMRLLSYQWTKNGLPNDENILARFCFTDRNAIASILHKFPVAPDGKRRNPRLEQDRAHKDARSNTNAVNATLRHGTAPSTDISKKIADIFHRRHSTEWQREEIQSFIEVRESITLPDLEIIHLYYETERAKGEDGRHRRKLDTFLNNYLGELDKAREWEASRGRKSANLNGHAKPQEPPGFRAWLHEAYPARADAVFAELSDATRDHLLKEFRNHTK